MLAADDSDSDLSEEARAVRCWTHAPSKFAHAYTMWVSLFHFFWNQWREARLNRMPMLAQPSALCHSVTLAAWKPVDLNMVEHVMTCHSGRRGWTDLTAPATVGHASWDPSLASTFFLKDQNLWHFVWKPAPLQVVQFCSRKKVKLETCVFWYAKIYKGWA